MGNDNVAAITQAPRVAAGAGIAGVTATPDCDLLHPQFKDLNPSPTLPAGAARRGGNAKAP